MIQNKLRIGNFTSSEIVALTKLAKNGKDFGVPALTYIDETNWERKLGRSISDESNARPLTWGKFLEYIVNDQLDKQFGLQYTPCSNDTVRHPTIEFWAGSPDNMKLDKGKTVGDIKCPLTLKSFCQLVDPLYNGMTGIDAIDYVRNTHKDGDKFYWQLVSNSIIKKTRYAELIVFMPYRSQLEEIKLTARDSGDPRYSWINYAGEDELPYLIDGGYYKNLNIIRFEVPPADKEFLTSRVLEAGKMLIQERYFGRRIKSFEVCKQLCTCQKRLTVVELYDKHGSLLARESNRCNPHKGICTRLNTNQDKSTYDVHSDCNWTHAEIMAIKALQPGDKPCKAVLYGHDFYCQSCEDELCKKGVEVFEITEMPIFK